VKKWDEYSKNRQRMEDYAVLKTKILTKSSTEIANAPLFEILKNIDSYRILEALGIDPGDADL
jgi:hypothetical protein